MEKLELSGVAWVGLYAEDLPALADFYAKRVGLPVIESSAGCCILDAGDGALFEIWPGGHASGGRKTTAEQSTLVGFRVEALEPVVEALRSRGVLPISEIGSYLGTRWIYFVDPEGNRFEFKDRRG